MEYVCISLRGNVRAEGLTMFAVRQIRDSKGDILSRKDDIPHGKMLKFSFVTETYDTFEICFMAHAIQPSFSGSTNGTVAGACPFSCNRSRLCCVVQVRSICNSFGSKYALCIARGVRWQFRGLAEIQSCS